MNVSTSVNTSLTSESITSLNSQIEIKSLNDFYDFLDLSVMSGATWVSQGDLYSCIIVSFFIFLWLCFVYIRINVML